MQIQPIKCLEFGTSEDRGSTIALFRAGGCVGNTYMQMKLHHVTAQIPPTIKEKKKPEESMGSQHENINALEINVAANEVEKNS